MLAYQSISAWGSVILKAQGILFENESKVKVKIWLQETCLKLANMYKFFASLA